MSDLPKNERDPYYNDLPGNLISNSSQTGIECGSKSRSEGQVSLRLFP